MNHENITSAPNYARNGAGYGGGAMQAPGREASPVERSQAALNETINQLHQSISSLETRLHSVLATVPTDPKGNPEALAPSSVAAQIEISAQVVAVAVRRIDSLLNRLEV